MCIRDSIGTALCLSLDKPLIYPRKTAKSYGTGKNVEGRWSIGQTAVVIDDLITSGDSVLETIAAVKAAGLHVHDAVAVSYTHLTLPTSDLV
mgnify:CR=1 FL=1